jgi:hypothetical protein
MILDNDTAGRSGTFYLLLVLGGGCPADFRAASGSSQKAKVKSIFAGRYFQVQLAIQLGWIVA